MIASTAMAVRTLGQVFLMTLVFIYSHPWKLQAVLLSILLQRMLVLFEVLTKLYTQSFLTVELYFRHCTSTDGEKSSNYSNLVWVLCLQSTQRQICLKILGKIRALQHVMGNLVKYSTLLVSIPACF